jgi:cyclase
MRTAITSGADATFQKLAPVIAHDNVRKRMAAGNEVTGDKPSPPEALPMITFKDELTLRLNGEEIRLLKLPPGHTDGDVAAFFKKANVVCMGDVFMSPAASFGDRHFGGGMLGLIAELEFVLPQIPDDAKIVPGHGVV